MIITFIASMAMALVAMAEDSQPRAREFEPLQAPYKSWMIVSSVISLLRPLTDVLGTVQASTEVNKRNNY